MSSVTSSTRLNATTTASKSDHGSLKYFQAPRPINLRIISIENAAVNTKLAMARASSTLRNNSSTQVLRTLCGSHLQEQRIGSTQRGSVGYLVGTSDHTANPTSITTPPHTTHTYVTHCRWMGKSSHCPSGKSVPTSPSPSNHTDTPFSSRQDKACHSQPPAQPPVNVLR